VLFSIGLHGYLALHFYPVRYASTSEASLCNVNATFNCDAVAASPYSQVMGLPLSILGLTANALFLVLLALQYLGLTDNPARTLRYALYFSLMIAGMSVLMGLISLAFMTVYCLFCILLYLFSFAQMELDESKMSRYGATGDKI
jgi:uncharacterized membrane protein